MANAARARLAARQTRDVQRRKNALESSALPAKLADCRSSDTDASELFIVEGDSALGTAKSARNSEFQALLPIRGKILNVQKASMADMLKNAECASILQVIGGGTGRSFDLDASALRQDHPDDRRRRRRGSHQVLVADADSPVHVATA
ncbi:MAG: toprim domain-containing protein [Candidatus Nanopelagicales bacterium]